MPRCSPTPPRSTPRAPGSGSPREVQARVWPTEDYEAALSFIPIAEGEDDLFAGIPTDVAEADALATSGDLQVALDTRTEREA